eukprot:CAMPEP_0198139688 /NCGR_PEP_ID=MMETSP1443-20131203/2955_1 /TAXON_ID=186043 /ORGANISM="Entomoneis sp., Strain CCMP2396" /LENGTH=517 /DNA_ID=CAMNT_0043801889 /DNA_START=56 /DNA_END=1609 /DNA_ORIENTATION=+
MSIISPDRSSTSMHEPAEVVSKQSSLFTEAKSLAHLAIPTIIIQLSFVVPPFVTASYVGRHLGHVYLDGYTLATVTGNLLSLALLEGFYNASDTLSPQAFGAGNYRQVGLLAIRGYVSTLMVMIPINIVLYFGMDKILRALGQDAEASEYAWQFYMIYALSFPFYSLYNICWKFLSAQNVLVPLVGCTLFSTLVVLPVTLELLVNSRLGFFGAALAITIFYIVESLAVVFWCWRWKPHHPETWPGLSAWREALEWKPFCAYLALGVGGMLAAFEWVYWEALALLIGTLGVLPLSAHTVPTQLIWVFFMVPMGLGIALAIRLGATLSQNASRGRQLALATFCFSVVVFGSTSILVYRWSELVFSIFTDEDAVKELCREIWFHVCLYIFLLSLFAINVGISIGLGMQWTLGIVTVVSLWLLGFPASYYYSIIKGGGLYAAWVCIWPPYVLINICMGITFLLQDWNEISNLIRIREGLEKINNGLGDGNLESLALIETCDNNNRQSTGQSNGYGSVGSNR